MTPGIFFSVVVDLRSSKPAADVPTSATLPSKNSGGIIPSITSTAETVEIFFVAVKYIHALPYAVVGIVKGPSLMLFIPV